MIPQAEIPAAPPVAVNTTRRAEPVSGTWFLLAACLLVWPAVFASVVVATFLAVAVYYDDPGGPLFWPLAWIGSAVVYSLLVGLPLVLCARRRRWYLRMIPAVIAVVPVGWTLAQAGAWAIPGAATIAITILVETTGVRHTLTMRAWGRLTSLRRVRRPR